MLLLQAVDDISIAESLMALTKASESLSSAETECDSDVEPLLVSLRHAKPDATSSLKHLTRLADEEFKILSSPTGIDESWCIDTMRKMEQGLKRMKPTHHHRRNGQLIVLDKDSECDLRLQAHQRDRKLSVSSWCSSDSDQGTKRIGSYSPEDRAERIQRYLEKRKHRTWGRKINYGVRKNFADSRLRVKGRFVKKEDEELLCLYLGMT
ncbi:hypothetical protein SPRG_11260 [Saprolegnia parasitica CBS 223.65]|uniref:CCT domain-containing protein n=1 Tax=Saprolegnia parasitica (strain CBS 223.65) TaxID=695850 RepID=A0A067BZY3_SAPPC|nr:hypothetical protein SPRG_11260 [Saprolegnia parasitica CBS 223.65]KDO23828.1 hypothetical protein SPRG_11260 [Saprolegnia parasitica CBS 223.65]|eukprot:XP_012205461.1 hypothetical protein SPRG_11260 [Saprolegnia parasitica CBS 223.65]